ncbi:hypothetical protein [Vibrio sp. WXL210]|uniref:hypothetical protein n=1 Tax=Vibrio sp. WXL210 TaxID=3450709 RepID=UPI003EC8B1CE
MKRLVIQAQQWIGVAVTLGALLATSHVQAAKLHAKALGEATSALRGSHSGWEYNPASNVYAIKESHMLLYTENSEILQTNGDKGHEWTSFGVSFIALSESNSVLAIGLDYDQQSRDQAFSFNPPNGPDSESIGGSVSDLTLGLAFRSERSGWQLGGALKGYDLSDDSVQSEGGFSYSLGIIKDWSSQLVLSPSHSVVISAGLGGYYRDEAKLKVKMRYSGEREVSLVPSSSNLGAHFSVTHLNQTLSYRLQLSLDGEKRQYLMGFDPDQSVMISKAGIEWRLFSVANKSSSVQLALRAGMQNYSEHDLDPLYSYGAALTWRNHMLDATYWQEYLAPNESESFVGFGYTLML